MKVNELDIISSTSTYTIFNGGPALKSLDRNSIQSVYSGKPGCTCGCRGKHSYAEAHRAVTSKLRGYEVSNDEISELSITRVLNRMLKNADKVELTVFNSDNSMHFSFSTETRIYIIYLLPEVK